jgi:aminoglycoside/choline kinase family phosphotransferase
VAVTPLIQRQQALQAWAAAQLANHGPGTLASDIVAVSGDASFRRYFRGFTATASVVLVDAPPDKENSQPFIDVDRRLLAAGVRVPRVIATDLAQGFMALEDFGNDLLWPALEQQRLAGDYFAALTLYQRCFDELLLIQRADAGQLPLYDDALLLREMRLFSEWFCGGLLQHPLSDTEQQLVEQAFAVLSSSARQQTRVFVHRDYHSRNLMLLSDDGIGVIDFQDAVLGPVTYDLVSLLKDCYIEWPREQVREWAMAFAQQAQACGILPTISNEQFLRDFDLMGAQRHIKVLGIFSRLWLRDGKSLYLKDIPLTFRYLQQVVAEQPSLVEFAKWLRAVIEPLLPFALERAKATAGQDGKVQQ